MEGSAMDNATAKKALRLFTYGIYVVTSVEGDEVAAMTANWVGQVSFEPRMVSVAFEEDAHTLELVRRSGIFAVNVLESGSREFAAQFSRAYSKVGSKLEGREYTRGDHGSPILPEALGAVECRVVLDNPVGDHVLIVGEVVQAYVNREGESLTMKEAGFRYSG
jgi:flavin reductase (DIM6/NTAB) family NADH-FMN oxidoreductase RutF